MICWVVMVFGNIEKGYQIVYFEELSYRLFIILLVVDLYCEYYGKCFR